MPQLPISSKELKCLHKLIRPALSYVLLLEDQKHGLEEYNFFLIFLELKGSTCQYGSFQCLIHNSHWTLKKCIDNSWSWSCFDWLNSRCCWNSQRRRRHRCLIYINIHTIIQHAQILFFIFFAPFFLNNNNLENFSPAFDSSLLYALLKDIEVLERRTSNDFFYNQPT